jgi:FkbM family methyltransferase
MFKRLLTTFIKTTFPNITEQNINAVYKDVLHRSANTDEIAHWISGGGTTYRIREELKQGYELWQKNNNRFRVLVSLPEFKIYAMQNDASVGASIIHSKHFEPHVGNAIKNNLKPGGVFLDLGANIGFFTLLAASIVKDTGKVISVEPNMQNLQLLYASILENKFTNIKVFPFAASDHSEILKLTSFGSNGLVGVPQEDHLNSQFLPSMMVDELLQNEEKIDLVKLDIEGYEPLAFKGMVEVVKKHNPVIISEFSPWHIEHRSKITPKEYLKLLSQDDYNLSILEPSGEIVSNVDIDFVMDYWVKLNNDKVHLDLMAKKGN